MVVGWVLTYVMQRFMVNWVDTTGGVGWEGDIIRWCKSCLTCVSHQVGRAIKPPLTPIPVAGPFDRVGVDVIQFPKSYEGSQYGIVFVDYVTKWPEVFAAPDQTSLTIAQLLVDHVICRHGVPVQLLSDRRKAFSSLMEDIYKLMGIHKVSTTAYHPQTNGLVERFNWTLTDMLAKTVDKSGRDWDWRLAHVLFAYRVSPQKSTHESPFFPFCMVEMPSFPQKLPWHTRKPDIKWTSMITWPNWLGVLAKPGNWPVHKSRKLNKRKSTMTCMRKNLSFSKRIVYSCTCLLKRKEG